MELGQILYRAIGVEIQGEPQGDVTVKRCYFRDLQEINSRRYNDACIEDTISGRRKWN
jgi:hypothetical protein